MFISKKIWLLVLSCILLPAASYSETKGAQGQYDTKFKLDSADVDKTIRELKNKLKADIKGKKKMPSSLLGSYAYKFKVYSLHPDIEEETEVYARWYSDLSESLELMNLFKSKFYNARASKNLEKQQECVLKYKKALSKCVALLKNPKKIKKEDLQEIRRKKSSRRRRSHG